MRMLKCGAIKCSVILALNLFSANAAYASKEFYECTIQEIRELTDSGKMDKHTRVFSQLLKEKFTVNRNTGEMIGLPFSTESYKEISVLDKGSKENAFKELVVSYPPNIWIKYIYIKEYVEGDIKPFWGTDDGDKIFTGTCVKR